MSMSQDQSLIERDYSLTPDRALNKQQSTKLQMLKAVSKSEVRQPGEFITLAAISKADRNHTEVHKPNKEIKVPQKDIKFLA